MREIVFYDGKTEQTNTNGNLGYRFHDSGGSLKSRTDPECGYIHQARKKGLGYLTEMTVDTSHGIITGVDCYPANQRESDKSWS